jgi:hypothetical protein
VTAEFSGTGLYFDLVTEAIAARDALLG